ncbi:MAG: AAA family ATPase [Archangium sp.]
MIDLLRELEAVELHAVRTAAQVRLQARFPGRVISCVEDDGFLVGAWASGTKETEIESPTIEVDVVKLHGERGDTGWHLFSGHERLQWRGHTFEVLTLQLPAAMCDSKRVSFIIGPSLALNTELFVEVEEWNRRVHGEVLVFAAGRFRKDDALQKSIEATRFDDLVLPDSLVASLRSDVKQFLASKDMYAASGAAWKRGVLLLGPPGNGKTHAIKAIVNDSKLPCVYVKSFTGRYTDPADSIAQVFERARSLAPCIVVLEDLDSLINDTNRSFLLNELDGFAANHGLITIASSNHPERLDPSLLHRPSRFDRKYRFELPDLALRTRYLHQWSKRLPTPAAKYALDQAAALTEGFTFAYLKETGLSTQMQLASEGQTRAAGDVLLSVVEGLKQEIATAPPERPAPAPPPMPPWAEF